jgi:hypothetical protein
MIRAIIRAVRPTGVANFDVRVSNTKGRGCAGRAYTNGSGYHATADPFVVVRIAKTDALARTIMRGGNGYLPSTWGNRIEALLFVLAHELRHMWQATHTRGKVWGSRGRYSERDADAYALRMLRAYRRGELGPLSAGPHARLTGRLRDSLCS